MISSKHSYQHVRMKIPEIQFFRTLRSHSSKCPPTSATIPSCLYSAQQGLTAQQEIFVTTIFAFLLVIKFGESIFLCFL